MRHPQTYLVNTAVHAAIDRIRQDTRLLSESEVSEFFELEDETPGPAEIAQSRSDMQGMFKALDMLTPRQLTSWWRRASTACRGPNWRNAGAFRCGWSDANCRPRTSTACARCGGRRTSPRPASRPSNRAGADSERRNNASKCVFRAFGVPFCRRPNV